METKVILNCLRDVIKNLETSDDFNTLSSDSPFFDDSLKVVSGRVKLRSLISALELVNLYSNVE